MFTELIDPRPAPAEGAEALQRFLKLLGAALATHALVKLSLSKPVPAGGADAADEAAGRVLARLVVLRDEPHLQLVHRHATKDITKNHPVAVAVEVIRGLLSDTYRHAHLHTRTHELQLSIRHKGGRDKSFLRVGKLPGHDAAPPDTPSSEAASEQAPAVPRHNRDKQRLLALTDPVWLDLGISHRQGDTIALVPAMARKWKQINRFTEIFSQALQDSTLASAERVSVIDFGCGRGYLTFAVHAWLQALGKTPAVTGVELREELVAQCNTIARTRERQGLRFDAGDVRHYTPPALDVMIALHACDTATDHAIHLGLRAGASIILCSPCCHKEVRPQMRSPAALRPLLQHGVHLGQEAEMVTDSLRALLLEAAGYEARIFEFVSLEHTNKNKMILAVRRAQPLAGQREAAQRQIDDIKTFYGLREQCLESLLKHEAPVLAAP